MRSLTFLFTDLEGSTRLWESEPARMAGVLARHDALCRATVRAHGGHLVKMIGDGLHAVFADPPAAIATALDLQRGMAAIAGESGLPASMRCGLHAGTAEERDGDYFGSDVNRAARLMGAAHGGQVLLSQAVVDAARERLPAGADVVPLGRVRLRDLAEPLPTWQLAHAALRSTFPALRALEATPNNLPQQVTSFIGREREMAAARGLLEKSRLLTLTGPGGCGKTRLALQVATEMLDDYPDGVWLVELAPLSDSSLVAQSVAAVLGVREERGRDLMSTLTEHLRTRHTLLVLDNSEHVLDKTVELATLVLRQCPDVSVLVTSRELLRIAGEQTYPVPSLAVPDLKDDASPDRVVACDAVRLFVERAQAQRADFAVDARNAPAIASICRRLDGIPLALELAAARVRSLAVAEIDRRLDERFRLLTGGARAALPRQQTLRALIDWSYDLLDAREKALLCRLAIFAGGWTLDTAEHVCVGDGLVDEEVLDLLAILVDRSLVMVEDHDGIARYRLLETVRHYALDRLRESGGAAAWEARHLAYFRALAEEAEPQLSAASQGLWIERLDREHDNIRAALAWSTSPAGDPSEGLRLAAALWWFWEIRGYLSEGRAWLSSMLAATPRSERSALRAKALNGAGTLARDQGDYRASQALHEESLAIVRALGDRPGLAATLNNLANLAANRGDYAAARALQNESLALRRELGDRKGISASLNNLGNLAREQADFPTARALFEESLAIDRSIGDVKGVAISLNNLGGVAADQGDYVAARALHEEALAIRRKLGDKRGIASSLTHLGHVVNGLGDPALARTLQEEGLVIRRELGDRKGIAVSLNKLASVVSELGDLASARALHEESLAIQRELGDRWGMASTFNDLGGAACRQRDFDAARDFYRRSLAMARQLGDRWGTAEALGGMGDVEFAANAPGEAACSFAAAERLREDLATTMSPIDRRHYDARLAELRAALGDAEFERHWQRGRALALDEAVDRALGCAKEGAVRG